MRFPLLSNLMSRPESVLIVLVMTGLSVSLLACSSSKETTENTAEHDFTLAQAAELTDPLEDAEVEERDHTIKVTFGTGLLFGFDSADLRSDARVRLSNLAASLQKNPNTRVTIVGHTDSVGTAAYNRELSERRAAAAAQVLMDEGVAPDRIQSEGRGESEPIASNATEEGRERNRRVEVIISVTPQDGSSGDSETNIMW